MTIDMLHNARGNVVAPEDRGQAHARFGAAVRTVLVVPCYNEEQRLPRGHITRALASDSTLGFLFVDDGSSDGTLDVLERMRTAHPRSVALLKLERNVGKAEAVRQGLIRAVETNARFVGFWDADMATPLSEVDRFVCELEADPSCEWLIGSRVRLLGRHIDRRPTRHYLGRIFATGASVILRMPVYDTQCGAKLFRNSPGLSWCLRTPFVSRWIFDVELLGRFALFVRANGGNPLEAIQELPLKRWVDVAGSKVSPSSFLRAAVELMAIRTALRREQRDLVFGAPGDAIVKSRK